MNYLVDQTRRRGTAPEATFLARLVVTFRDRVASREGVTPRANNRTARTPVRAQFPGAVWRPISESRTQKRSLTHRPWRRRSAPPRCLFTGKGFLPLSWLSYSPSVVSTERRTWSKVRFGLSRASKLPTPANVERTSRAFHPIGRLKQLWSEPRRGITPMLIEFQVPTNAHAFTEGT